MKTHLLLFLTLVLASLVWLACESVDVPTDPPPVVDPPVRPLPLSSLGGTGNDTAKIRITNLGNRLRFEVLDPTIRYELNGKEFKMNVTPILEEFEWEAVPIEETPVPREG